MAAFTEEQVKDFSIKNWYDLSGQVAVVTGGATGLGLAITRCLVSAGAKVAVVASRAPELVADTLAEFGGKAVYYQFNITDTDHAQELADKITAEQGPVSILVNNAGNHCKKFIWDMTVDDYKRVLDVHLVGAFALTKAFVPQMKEQGHGRIIFQASMTSYIGQPQVAGYSTAKAGYLGLIHTLTAELAEYGITASMSRRGDCWDNACSETLFGSLKVERLHGQRFKTRRQAMDEVVTWMLWYNQTRLHSTLGYVSPVQFEEHWLANQPRLACA